MKKKVSEQYNLMMEGKSYYIDDYLFRLQNKTAKALLKINALPFNGKRRNKLLSKLFSNFGTNNIVKCGFFCNYGFNISVGSNCLFNANLVILDSTKVTIGNNVFIAPNVTITPVAHPLDQNQRKSLILKPIIIEDNVWIGANAVILPGVTIHKGAVVGASALVREDVMENEVVAGVPAKVIKMGK